MSEEQLKAFLEKVKGDTSLQEKLKTAADANAVIAIAKEAGFMISVDDINKAQSEISEISEITEEELESIAAGGNWMGNGPDGTYTPVIHASFLCNGKGFDAWVASGFKDQG